MSEPKRAVNVNLSVELHRQLKVFAAERGLTISGIITALITQVLDGRIKLDGGDNGTNNV